MDTGALAAFFQLTFGTRNTGYICLAFMSVDKKTFEEEFYEWPAQLDKMLESITIKSAAWNVYFCPQLLDTRRRKKDNVKSCPNVWADLDTCTPDKLLVDPTIVVESSPGRFQALWVFEDVQDPTSAEDTARRIAYYHAASGADRSGWDLTQLLRVPGTFNFKYGESYAAPEVVVRTIYKAKFRLADFEMYPPVRGTKDLRLPFPVDLPTEDPEHMLQRNRYRLAPSALGLFSSEPESDWSKSIWRLMMYCFEAGMSREEVYCVAKAAACNKYTRDGKPDEYIWRDVCRAYLKQQEITNSIATASEMTELLSDEEVKGLEGNDTFVEQYIRWASSLGDAAVAYHQAGAFTVLSSLLAGAVRIPTSFGSILPNLWFMILGDTTLTRKSTAMDLGMELVTEINEDLLLATDGSIEGLLGAMVNRPGQPSVFLRDEFSGLLESMSRKDYMAGMSELLTKLYDGKPLKRVLRKETFTVRKPILIIFAGGIKSRIQGLLTFDDVSSGFMPRFIFVTAQTDIQKVQKLGPPTIRNLGHRDFVLGRMRYIADFYSQTELVSNSAGLKLPQQKIWDVELTADAWARFGKLEDDMLFASTGSSQPDLLVPTFQRLNISILKAAALIAASRQQNDKVLLEEEDLIRAIRYGSGWRDYAVEILNGIGKTSTEREMDRILNAIVKSPGVSRSTLMQNHHLTARSADVIFGTLEQRGRITMTKVGKGQVFYPTLEVGE